MKIYFQSKKLQRQCSEEREMKKTFGEQFIKKLKQRLWELSQADSLLDVSYLPPPRCHELINRKGVFSVDLEHPYRLLFSPKNTPYPLLEDGGIDRELIEDIVVLAIEDTHDGKDQRRGCK